MEGFERINEHAFPGMSLTVTGKNKDTVLVYEDLYSELVDGIRNSPLSLVAELALAEPVHSGNDYTLFAHIWDK